MPCGQVNKDVTVEAEATDYNAVAAYDRAKKAVDIIAGKLIRQFQDERCPGGCGAKINESYDIKIKKVYGWPAENNGYTIKIELRITGGYFCPPLPPPPPPPPVQKKEEPGKGKKEEKGKEEEKGKKEEKVPEGSNKEVPPPPPCNEPCNCLGPRCILLPPQHSHCPNHNKEGSGFVEDYDNGCAPAGGRCVLPAGHAGLHWCAHKHGF